MGDERYAWLYAMNGWLLECKVSSEQLVENIRANRSEQIEQLDIFLMSLNFYGSRKTDILFVVQDFLSFAEQELIQDIDGLNTILDYMENQTEKSSWIDLDLSHDIAAVVDEMKLSWCDSL